MAEKKKIIMLALIMAMMAALMILTTGCITKTEDVVETESGWTIEEDGSYTYACVIKNVSEDKIISSGAFVAEGLDADDNVMKKKPDFATVQDMIGPIMPGGKAAIIIDKWATEDPVDREWEETPAAFRFNVNIEKLSGTEDNEAESIPDIRIASAEPSYIVDDYSEYVIVLENNGKEDVNADFTGAGDFLFHIYAVFRDEDGKITGGSTGILRNSDEDVISLPAGEEVAIDVGFNSIPEGEPEFVLNLF